MTTPTAVAAAVTALSALVVLLSLGIAARRSWRRRVDLRRRALSEPVRPHLLELLAGEPDEQAAAATRLSALDRRTWGAVEPSVVALLGKVRGEGRREVVRVLAHRGVLARARRDLRAPSASRRARAAELLGVVEEQAAVRPLVRLLRDRDAEVRLAAARALGRLGAPQAAGPLLAALEAVPARVPGPVVAQALLRIGSAAAGAASRALASPSTPAATTAAEVLGRLGEASALEGLRERLEHDERPAVRARAATALGRLGLPAALPALLPAVGPHEDPAVRVAATRALGELGATGAAPVLCALLDDDDDRVAAEAGPALLRLGAHGLDLLRRADEDGALPGASARAREALALAALRGLVPAGAP